MTTKKTQTGSVKMSDFQDYRIWIEPIDREKHGCGRWIYNSELIKLIQTPIEK